ncbi:hypothetical protein [Saccharopolyspora rectivirgula]|uniref:hypothetical protein n=1 Tax=Saccharopolyspora rectivirgula TaxID=28042 RepID=UPI0013635AE0|nr:hypothetical protein [Saccharopolyspora rectivirgula]
MNPGERPNTRAIRGGTARRSALLGEKSSGKVDRRTPHGTAKIPSRQRKTGPKTSDFPP